MTPNDTYWHLLTPTDTNRHILTTFHYYKTKFTKVDNKTKTKTNSETKKRSCYERLILRRTTFWNGILSVRLIRKTLFIQLMLSNELADVVLGVRTKPKTMNKLLNPLSKHLVLRNYCCWCQKSTFQKRWQLVNLLGQIPFIVVSTTKQLWYMGSYRLKISRNIWFGGTAEKTYICK